jgi:hypothetical protein
MAFVRKPAAAFQALALVLALCSCGGAVDLPSADAAIADTAMADGAVGDAPATDPETDVVDAGHLEVTVGSPPVSCPAAEPNVTDPCNWPSDLQCTYLDKCGAFGCNDSITCVAGHYQVFACGYALTCPVGKAAPKTGDSCACGTGYSVHYFGESGPCRYACVEGPLTATCDAKTEKWVVSGPSVCTPLPDGGATDASRE